MSPSRHIPRARTPRRYRLSVASRAVAALVGAYALASAASAFLALALPLPREEAVQAGFLAAFGILPAAVLWVFAASTAWRAWLGLFVPGLALGLGVCILRAGGAA
jgi:hypothetical protein